MVFQPKIQLTFLTLPIRLLVCSGTGLTGLMISGKTETNIAASIIGQEVATAGRTAVPAVVEP